MASKLQEALSTCLDALNVKMLLDPGQEYAELQSAYELLKLLRDMTGTPRSRLHALNCIMRERERQEAKWGEQHHERLKWLAILAEEFGEVAEATLEQDKGKGIYTKEVTETATVAVNMLEDQYKRG